EKRRLFSMGLAAKGFARRYAAGLGIGLALIALVSLPALMTEEVAWLGFSPIAVLYLLAFVVQGASEEMFFRGFMMPDISRRTGILWSVVITSAIFAILHIFNGGMSILSITSLFLIGAFLALITLRTNSLWTACALHTAWNFGSGLVASSELGGYSIDYPVVRVGDINMQINDYGIVGEPGYIIVILIFIAAAAFMLFAGKQRLVVRRPPPEQAAGEQLPE
ncbi:MAG: CPBP family intramembrane metalloprotease, partial [Eubacteriales bacterium]|nr:CPBP family intramembrane metalloprotease [Eubacteriales bacterium]